MATTIVLAGILGLTTLFYGLPKLTNTTYIQSSVDENFYNVLNVPNKEAAADILARLRQKLEKLKTHVIEDKNIDQFIRLKMNNLDLDNIQENTMNSKYTAYSINKGERLHFCVRNDKNGGNIKDEPNTLMFVALHEIAHVITKTIGHTEEFWKNQKVLMEIAIDLGIYQRTNYSKTPISYCGQIITSQEKSKK